MAIGKLDFHIPGEDAVTLSFQQNINVAESKAANYAKYDILARSSTIYAYLGAKSRTIKLSFDILADHLAAFPQGGGGYSFGEIGSESDFGGGGGEFGTEGVGADTMSEGTGIGQLDYWIETIRRSVANEGDDPTLGPPTVVFSYTKSYKDISCICKDYKIDLKGEDSAGFIGANHGADGESEDGGHLSPRLVSFSLTLEEIK